jgi:hypothetical protein
MFSVEIVETMERGKGRRGGKGYLPDKITDRESTTGQERWFLSGKR